MSYAVPVERLAVRMIDRAGEPTEVTVFLHAAGGRDPRPETLGDRLNDESQRFLACEVDDGIELVRLDGLACVEVSGEIPELRALREIGARRQRVEMEVAGAGTLGGELVYEAPAGRDRVSDLLNGRPTRFLLLLRPAGPCYVHRDAIRRVRV